MWMQLDDWVLCRIYKKTTPQLYCSPPHDDETSMDGGLDLGRQPDGSSASVGDIVAAYAPAGGLPRPASISDYLVDFNYSPVSELLESMPAPETAAQLGTMDATGRLFYAANHGEAAASSSSTAQQQSSHKQRCPTTGTRRRRASRGGDGGVPGGATRERVGDGQGLIEDSVFEVEGRGRGPEVGV